MDKLTKQLCLKVTAQFKQTLKNNCLVLLKKKKNLRHHICMDILN